MGIERQIKPAAPEKIIFLQNRQKERIEATMEAAREELARAEKEIAALENEPQTGQLDNAIRGLRDKADFMRTMLENSDKTDDDMREYQRRQLERITNDGAIH